MAYDSSTGFFTLETSRTLTGTKLYAKNAYRILEQQFSSGFPLIGIARDGRGVYGGADNDLDSCGGHVGFTHPDASARVGEGLVCMIVESYSIANVYHYHLTPWSAECFAEAGEAEAEGDSRAEAAELEEDAEDVETAEPVADTETAEPVADTETAEPVAKAEPVADTETAEPVVDTETAEPVADTETAEPVVDTETAEPVAGRLGEPVMGVEVVEVEEAMDAVEPVKILLMLGAELVFVAGLVAGLAGLRIWLYLNTMRRFGDALHGCLLIANVSHAARPVAAEQCDADESAIQQ